VRGELGSEMAAFLNPAHLYSRQEVLAGPSPVPAADGVYGWWFRRLPASIDTRECARHDGLTLLYIGISPSRPPKNGRPASRQNLRKRLRQRYARSAEASTLRRTLGCLLADELGLQLRRVGSSGRRTTFVTGEQVLSDWMAENAFVSWIARARPWELEDQLIQELDLPLNLRDNSRNPFHPKLTEARARCLARAGPGPCLCCRMSDSSRLRRRLLCVAVNCTCLCNCVHGPRLGPHTLNCGASWGTKESQDLLGRRSNPPILASAVPGRARRIPQVPRRL
jgi:hypothetical protein